MAEPADSVFSKPADTTTTQDAKIVLDDWVGEGKKFTSVEQLVESYGHSQDHIVNLERTQSELREDLGKRSTVEEIYEKFGKTSQSTQTTSEDPSVSITTKDSFTRDEVEALIEKGRTSSSEQFKNFEDKLQGDNNERAVDAELRKTFGESAGKALQDKAKALGKSVEDMRDLSRNDPKMFMALFQGQSVSSSQSTMTSSVNMDQSALADTTPDRNFAYYENIRRTNPKDYFTPKIQKMLIEDALKYGSDFHK